MNTTQFCQEHQIVARVNRALDNPNIEGEHTDKMHHWRVTLIFQGKEFMVPFSQGSAITRAPGPDDVLDCLACDCSGIGQIFEDWASDYGYDTDSRKAEQLYQTCQQQSKKLRDFLGPKLYLQLINDVERL